MSGRQKIEIDFELGEFPIAYEATIDHGIKVEVIYDQDAEHANPRDCDNPSIMYVNYRGYELGDERLPDDGLPCIECPVCEGGEREEEPECPRCEGWHEVEPTVDEWLRSMNAIAAAPLFVYEHSGITMSIGTLRMVDEPITRTDTRSSGRFMGDDAGWDTSFVGFIVYTEESLTRCCGDGAKYRTREWLSECAEGEVREYARYLEGEVFGFNVESQDGTFHDSCWGIIGDEYAREEAAYAAAYIIEQVENEMRERAEQKEAQND